MRAGAGNFTLDELGRVAYRAHEQGVRAYLTLNTLLYETELPALEEVMRAAKAAEVDAVIASDFAVLATAKRHALPVHVSTQLSVSNSEALAFLFEQGVRRVVLARECTLEDLVLIRSNLKERLGARADQLKLEVFAHGAMCVAVSGRCFMSGFESGRSANRGECAQPCRRSYRISSERGGDGFELEERHVLSPQDLCTLPFLEQLLDTGVDSLKIEGRNRSPDYVFTVVSTYRRALNFYQSHRQDSDFNTRFDELKSKGMTDVSKVYNRGFSNGFYMGKPAGDWTAAPGNHSSHRREYIGQVVRKDPAGGRITLRLESTGITVGEEVFVENAELGYHPFAVEEMWREGKKRSVAIKGQCVDLPPHPLLQVRDRVYRLAPR